MNSIRVCHVEFSELEMHTRFPFRYGIASMTRVPHWIVRAHVEVEGKISIGQSADGLPPKWFTKNPETSFESDDLPAMVRVIRHAADLSQQLGLQPNFFSWWLLLYTAQYDWAKEQQIAPLLAGLGVSLLERAVLDAVCRRWQVPLFQILKENRLQIEFGRLRPALGRILPTDFLPRQPLESVFVRHTVGLGDPLLDASEISAARPDDDLPYTLAENIAAYGLRFFKIKLSGNISDDGSRLLRIVDILQRQVGSEARVTLDGNESYRSMEDFQQAWRAFATERLLQEFLQRCLLFVEQPLHRSVALDDSVRGTLCSWKDAPPVIIDESDADLESLPRALSLGYSGTSHKNCKGIIKGLLNAATIAQQRNARGNCSILSAEDLGNVGPIALLQDLAMVAILGIPHVERNGHHYFAGLSMFSGETQQQMLASHGDLYTQSESGFARLSIVRGQLALSSVNRSPFGLFPQISEPR